WCRCVFERDTVFSDLLFIPKFQISLARFWIETQENKRMKLFPSKSFPENPKSAIQNPKWLRFSVIAFVLVVTGAVAQAQQPGKIFRIGLLEGSTDSGMFGK